MFGISTAVFCVMCLVLSSISTAVFCIMCSVLSSISTAVFCVMCLVLSSISTCRLLSCGWYCQVKSKYFYCRILCHVLGIVKSKIFSTAVFCAMCLVLSSQFKVLSAVSSVICVEYYQVKSKSKPTYFLLPSSESSVEYCQVNQVQTNSTTVFCVMCWVLSSQVIVLSTAVFYMMF